MPPSSSKPICDGDKFIFIPSETTNSQDQAPLQQTQTFGSSNPSSPKSPKNSQFIYRPDNDAQQKDQMKAKEEKAPPKQKSRKEKWSYSPLQDQGSH